jgi:integrase
MASLSIDKNGNATVQFIGADRKRRSIRLGKVALERAKRFRRNVEALNVPAGSAVGWDRELAEWIADLDNTLRGKLARVGLLPNWCTTLAEWLDRYLATRTDLKPATRWQLRDARNKLVGYFGAEKLLCEITPGDADQFRLHLADGLSDNTVRRICGRAKQFFRAAERKRLIWESPFGDMKAVNVRANKEREFFITRGMADKVLEACPDAQWRLLFALCRYGGLRCPSEVLTLTWGDVDWGRRLLTVHSPKTAHHEGKASRVIPIFPELAPYLDKLWDQVEEGTEYVITRYRSRNANLRTQLQRIIKRAGLVPWPKLFQNLRSTRETELAETFPIHVVCAWIGNSRAIAAKHYLQVTADHVSRALQKAVQQGVAGPRNEPSAEGPMRENTDVYESVRIVASWQAPPVGLEPTTKRLTAARSTN